MYWGIVPQHSVYIGLPAYQKGQSWGGGGRIQTVNTTHSVVPVGFHTSQLDLITIYTVFDTGRFSCSIIMWLGKMISHIFTSQWYNTNPRKQILPQICKLVKGSWEVGWEVRERGKGNRKTFFPILDWVWLLPCIKRTVLRGGSLKTPLVCVPPAAFAKLMYHCSLLLFSHPF